MSKDIREEYWFEKFGHPRDNKANKDLQEIINFLEVMNDKEVIKYGNTLYNQGKKELLNDIRKMSKKVS